MNRSAGPYLALLCSFWFAPAIAEVQHNVSMQGGGAPADARDPHEYAAGTTLTSGPYALPESHHMHMADEHYVWSTLFDRLEYSELNDEEIATYDAEFRYGNTYDKLIVKAEGEISGQRLEEAQTELLWSHARSAYWDTQWGVRQNTGHGPNRSWLAVGVQGLAPYWLEVDTTFYLRQNGDAALRFETEYEMLITQRFILQPRVELNVYGNSDAAAGVGSGLSDIAAGLRLRYEFHRQLTPYVGVEWTHDYGKTADFSRLEDESVSATRWVAGLRFWF